jgi:ABC-type nitrate/sulfonate/bicarbonate transport system permease component
LSTLTAMFNPLPAITLLPLALPWFGLGSASLIFVLIHAVLWPLALATYAGFQGVWDTLRLPAATGSGDCATCCRFSCRRHCRRSSPA